MPTVVRDTGQLRPIEIRLIRQNANGIAYTNPSRDDVHNIRKIRENLIHVVYTENSGDGKIIDIHRMNYQQFMAYLYRLFSLLTLDEDPFQSIQTFVPGYPTILVTVDTLKANQSMVMEFLFNTLWNWPSIGAPVSGAPVSGDPIDRSPIRSPEQPSNGDHN